MKHIILLSCALAGFSVFATNPNDFLKAADDAAQIQAAVDAAAKSGENYVRIPAINKRTGKAIWNIGKTILLPSKMTVILENCHMRMTDGSICNFFSNSEAWTKKGLTEEGEQFGISIIGEGQPMLDGGEFNGWGETTEKQTGKKVPFEFLFMNSPIYFHNVRDFRVENLHIYHQRYWAMTYSYCSRGTIRNIRFEADLSWCELDMTGHDPNRHDIKNGEYDHLWVKNGDGCDLRPGCHDILVENVYGFTEDDGVAMTTLPGSEDQLRVGNRPMDIWNVTVRDNRIHVWRYAAQVRMLCSGGHKIHDILIDGIQDPSTADTCNWQNGSAILLSDCAPEFLGDTGPRRRPVRGDTYNITIRNVYTRAMGGIRLFNDIEGLLIENLHLMKGCHTGISCPLFAWLHNVTIRGVYTEAADGDLDYVFDWFKVEGDNVNISDIHTAPSAQGVIIHQGYPSFVKWDNVLLPTNKVMYTASGDWPRFGGYDSKKWDK